VVSEALSDIVDRRLQEIVEDENGDGAARDAIDDREEPRMLLPGIAAMRGFCNRKPFLKNEKFFADVRSSVNDFLPFVNKLNVWGRAAWRRGRFVVGISVHVFLHKLILRIARFIHSQQDLDKKGGRYPCHVFLPPPRKSVCK
jgi:hypothetical protein